MYNKWLAYISRLLPKEEGQTSEWITKDLLTTINQYYVLPLLLNGRDEKVRDKIEGCIMERTSHIRKKIEKRRFVIKGQTQGINYDEVYQVFMDTARPEIANIVNRHKELKKQNDNEVRGKLLPLLKKYISKPI